MIDIALKYLESGLSVIPVDVKTKQPKGGLKWKDYQHNRMSPDQAFSLFSDADGIAIIGGEISGNLEIIDFDNHSNTAKRNFSQFCKIPELKEILSGMIAEKTQSGGYHLFYRCEKIEGNRKIAQILKSDGKPDTIIETRGEGGYVVVAPSKGYDLIGNSDFSNVKTISISERDLMMEYLHSFNEYVRPDQTFHHETFNSSDERPGDEYNKDSSSSTEALALLNRAGWVTNNGKHFRRPNKKDGVSATYGHCSVAGIPLFYVFSSNAYPFESFKSYKPFQIFALLAHAGDFQEAAKELAGRGLGKQFTADPKFKEAYKRISEANRKGMNMKEAAAVIEDIPEEKVSEIVKKIYEENKDEHGFDKKPDIEKAEIYLRKNYEFRRNVVTMQVEMNQGQVWQDLNIDSIYRDLQHKKIKFGLDNIKSLMSSDFITEYDPFKEYFEELPDHTGEDYFAKFSKYLKTPDQDFFAKMLRKHFVRAIKCAIEPDYYNRIVFTFLSTNQEIGKSWMVNWFNPFGSKYYSDEFLMANKDSMFALSENFIYNLEELDTLSSMDVGKLKSIISKRGVKDRPAYARQKIQMPRRCTFFGSTNREEFLIDDSNTRWLVFRVDSIDWKYSEMSVTDLWAEAYAYYKYPDFNCEFTKEEKNWRDRQNLQYQVGDIERTLILDNFEASDNELVYKTNADILLRLGEIVAGRVRLTTTTAKIGRIMMSLGFKSGQKWIGDKNYRVYYVTDKNKVDPNVLPF